MRRSALKKCIILMFFSIPLFVMVFASVSADGAKGNKITFAIMLPPSLLGKGSATIWDNLIQLKKAVRKKNKIDVEFVKYRSWSQVTSALESGKADLAWLPPYYYVAARRNNTKSKIRPMAIYESGGRTESRTCIYMIPGEGGFPEHEQSLDLLFGSRLSFNDESSWILLNYIFHDTEYRFEPFFFFKSFRMLTKESAALALLFKELDSVIMDELSMKYIQEMDERLKKVAIIECSRPLPNTLIVRGSSLNGTMEVRARQILFSMHRNQDFGKLRSFFRITDGRWVPADKVDMSAWGKVVDNSRRMGWDKTFDTLPKE